MWNIRKIVKKGEYLYAVVPEHPKAIDHGYVLAHRIVAENMLGRLLSDNEEVHHKNRNKHDNRPENLEVLTKEQHRDIHKHDRTRTMVSFVCAYCSGDFQREIRQLHNGNKVRYCSKQCYWSSLRGRSQVD